MWMRLATNQQSAGVEAECPSIPTTVDTQARAQSVTVSASTTQHVENHDGALLVHRAAAVVCWLQEHLWDFHVTTMPS
jgi:hypothetical protein